MRKVNRVQWLIDWERSGRKLLVCDGHWKSSKQSFIIFSSIILENVYRLKRRRFLSKENFCIVKKAFGTYFGGRWGLDILFFKFQITFSKRLTRRLTRGMIHNTFFRRFINRLRLLSRHSYFLRCFWIGRFRFGKALSIWIRYRFLYHHWRRMNLHYWSWCCWQFMFSILGSFQFVLDFLPPVV